MGRAKLEGELAPYGERLDHNDGADLADDGPQDRGQPDRATARDEERGPGLAGQGVHHGAGARLDAAAERPGQREVEPVGDLDDVALAGDGVGGEGRLAEEVAAVRRPVGVQRASAPDLRSVE